MAKDTIENYREYEKLPTDLPSEGVHACHSNCMHAPLILLHSKHRFQSLLGRLTLTVYKL